MNKNLTHSIQALALSSGSFPKNEPIPFNCLTSLYWLQQTIGFDRSLWKHIDMYTPNRRKRYYNFLDDAVFIVGAPRSGTTFLGDVLSLDFQFIYFFEVVALKAMASLVNRCKLRGEKYKFMMEFYYGVLMWRHKAFGLRVLDKNPMHCFTIRELSKVYKRAKFIFIYRDGRDVALSLRRSGWHNENRNHNGGREIGGFPLGSYPWWYIERERRDEYTRTSDIHRCMWIWRIYNQEALRAINDISSERVLWVRYEDLIKQPAQEVKKCFSFMGANQSSELRSRTDDFLKQVMYGNSGKYKNALNVDELKLIEMEGGDMLRKLRYM